MPPSLPILQRTRLNYFWNRGTISFSCQVKAKYSFSLRVPFSELQQPWTCKKRKIKVKNKINKDPWNSQAIKEMLQITQIYSEQVWTWDWVIAHDLEWKESLPERKKVNYPPPFHNQSRGPSINMDTAGISRWAEDSAVLASIPTRAIPKSYQ